MPDLAPHEILVKLAVTGVCGTDMGLASGHLGPCRDILGHEGVGYVVELGSGVLPSQVEVGQRVGIAWLRDICGKCAFCLADGGEVRCVEQMNSGRKLDGTFAEYALIPSRYIIRIPKEISLPDPVIAPILCGGVTAYKALKIAGISGGQWVAISGAGGDVGSLGIQYARAMGYRVLAIDVGDTKGKFCLSLGADKFIDAAQEKDLANAVCKATNGRMAHAVLVTAGSTKAYQDALRIVAPFGAFVCVGIPPPTQHITFHPLTFIDKGIRLLGSAVGTKGDILEALEFVQRGMVKPSIQMIDLENLTNVAKDVTNTEVRWS